MKRAKAPVSVAVRVWQGVGASTLAILACSAPGCGGGPATLGGLEQLPPDASVGHMPDAQGSSGGFSDDGAGSGSDDGLTGDASDDGSTGADADDGSADDGSAGPDANDGSTVTGDGSMGTGADGGGADASSDGSSGGGSSGGGTSDGSVADASHPVDASSDGSSGGGTNDGGLAGDGGGIVDAGAGDGASGVDGGGGSPADAGADSSSPSCGATTCNNPHGSTSCSSGTCSPVCASGYASCDGNPNNGCETDTNTDPLHCGACGTACASTTPACNGGTCGCNIDVSWAIKVTVNVSWPATLVLQAAGDGEPGGSSEFIDIWALLSPAGTPSGLSIASTIEPCNITLPDFASTLGETYGVTFPPSLFDHSPSFLSPVGTTLNLGAYVPATPFTMNSPVTTLIGMSAPATGAWPAAASGVTEIDMDADGEPGVTALAKSGTTYADIPTSYDFINPIRADELYMAIRSNITSLSGSMSNCTTASGGTGSVVVSKMDSHILGCRVDAASGGGDCPAGNAVSGAIFVDDNRPVFVINSASFSAKVVSTASCSAVVAAIP